MESLENKLTKNNIELFKTSPEWEKHQETERKFVLTGSPDTYMTPERWLKGADYVASIDQLYLSHPDDEFSLRLRRIVDGEGTHYTAALKDRGHIENSMLSRLEIETAISSEAYDYYAANPRNPHLHKQRIEYRPPDERCWVNNDGLVTLDFIDGLEHPVVEIESNLPFATIQQRLALPLEEHTDDGSLLNETIAHQLHEEEGLQPSAETEAQFVSRVANEMVTYYLAGLPFVAMGISGMSGSGKSTVAREVQTLLRERYGEEFEPVIISTDDYHHGKRWLEATYGAPWTNWDEPRVYNTKELAADLKTFRAGQPLHKKHFDFISEEVVIDDIIQPRPFVIIEGLFADSRDLAGIRAVHAEMPVSPATSIGRDVRRLVIESRANGVFGSPEARLQYQLETALPSYEMSRQRPRNLLFRGALDAIRRMECLDSSGQGRLDLMDRR